MRISRDIAGEALGVQRQEQECRALAERLGLDVVEVYADNDLSAYSGKPRPAYERMLADVESGRVQVVIAWHADRLYRAMPDLERFVDICERTRCEVRTVTSGDLDLSTASGRMSARILGAVARQETERRVERQRLANAQRRAAGKRHAGGQRAFGYERDMTVVEAEAQAVREAYEHVLSGGTIRGLATRWNAAGLTTTFGNAWRSSGVRDVLRNPAYIAKSALNREAVADGSWQPLVDLETWSAVQTILDSPERMTHRTDGRRKYLLPSILTCGKCGGKMVTGRTERGVRTYVCEHRHMSRKAEPVDNYVIGQVIGRIPTLELRPRDADTRQEDDTAALTAKLQDLAVAYAEDKITLAQMEAASQALRTRLDAAQERQARLQDANVVTRYLVDPHATWHMTDDDQHRALIVALTERIVLQPVGRGTRGFDPESVQITWADSERIVSENIWSKLRTTI